MNAHISLGRALAYLDQPHDPERAQAAETERAASAALEQATGRAARGLTLPLGRALDISSGSGGQLIGAPVRSLAEALREASVVMAAGAQLLPDLDGTPAVPTVASGAAASWVDEGAAPAAGTLGFSASALAPKTVAATVPYSRRMALLASPAVDALLERDLAAALAAELDAAALGVSADAAAPPGLAQALAGGAGDITFSGATPTWAELLGMERMVRASNAPGPYSWIMSPAMAEALAQLDVGPRFALERSFVSQSFARITAAVPDGTIFFGAFNDLVIGTWGGVDLRLDRQTAAASDTRIARAFLDAALHVRRTSSFVMGVTP